MAGFWKDFDANKLLLFLISGIVAFAVISLSLGGLFPDLKGKVGLVLMLIIILLILGIAFKLIFSGMAFDRKAIFLILIAAALLIGLYFILNNAGVNFADVFEFSVVKSDWNYLSNSVMSLFPIRAN